MGAATAGGLEPPTRATSAFPAACDLDANSGEAGVDVPGARGEIVVAAKIRDREIWNATTPKWPEIR